MLPPEVREDARKIQVKIDLLNKELDRIETEMRAKMQKLFKKKDVQVGLLRKIVEETFSDAKDYHFNLNTDTYTLNVTGKRRAFFNEEVPYVVGINHEQNIGSNPPRETEAGGSSDHWTWRVDQ